MTDTLFDAVLALGRVLGGMKTHIATGGSTSTIIDTNSPYNDDYYNRGTALIVANASAAGVAPEGEFAVLADFNSSSTKFDVDVGFSTAVATGDRFALIPPRWPLDMMVDKINAVLTGIPVPQFNSTAITTGSNQTEYTLPTAIPGSDVRRVYYQTYSSTKDNQWREIRDWEVIRTGTATGDTLILPQLADSQAVRLDYVAPHSALYNSTQQINEHIHLDRIVYRAAEYIMVDQMTDQSNYKSVAQMANYFASKADEMESTHPVRTPPMNGKIKMLGGEDSSYTGEVGKVRL